MVYWGCYYHHPSSGSWRYLPQVALQVHATILSTTSRTTLTQIFTNRTSEAISEVAYRFPLYEGVSIVRFQCRVGDRILRSEVRTKYQANQDYQNAASQGQSAAVLDQSGQESDIFLLRIGNVTPHALITVDITFVHELQTDSQTDGIRYTLPNAIAPRYGVTASDDIPFSYDRSIEQKGLAITVDVKMEKGSAIREVQSPSHPVHVSLGRISSSETSADFAPHHASASLRLEQEHPLLDQEFVLIVKADNTDSPRALLESHPTILSQRALMATLVPKFHLPPARPEVIFVVDRSASMSDKISTLRSALQVFLKSLPVGISFNICSFGSRHSLLWSRSQVYNSVSLHRALALVETMSSDMGGTNMLDAVEAVVKSRLKNQDLAVLILTDGEITRQEELFHFVRATSADHTARFFTLGIGEAVSHALIQGVARAGNGIGQSVLAYEELDRMVVRILKGALGPHIYDYTLKIQYDDAEGDFNMVDHDPEETETETLHGEITTPSDDQKLPQKPILLTVYLLLNSTRTPQSLSVHATSNHGPLELQVPIEDIGSGETIHQLAARKAIVELEEGHGWLTHSSFEPSTKSALAILECQRLGLKFQVPGELLHPWTITLAVVFVVDLVVALVVALAEVFEVYIYWRRGKIYVYWRRGVFVPAIPSLQKSGYTSTYHKPTNMSRTIGRPSGAATRGWSSPSGKRQTFDGTWLWSPALFASLELDQEKTRTQLAQWLTEEGQFVSADFPQGDDATVLATLLVIAHLEERCASTRDIWDLMREKAGEWVHEKTARMDERGVKLLGLRNRIRGIVMWGGG
ncbi:hypothetical protein BO70DRAFT_426290 [Aspergillus heteromorphus CBS 117.55]|uniref:von Willebrand domain protein n=1 Tax=Aspergillus heteromorphus CBS 117.55 TaxID=1448321 RepID=A0A317WTW8_9EURO|nr:uncharacterized protein BO70DRAFT_426290 [Aspergillus heteromorphus CBS 117.55]PWY89854.1 hypothetical protein BO70DRAFT_426290 [Aspergillus heteromorphus CBS 117.55]